MKYTGVFWIDALGVQLHLSSMVTRIIMPLDLALGTSSKLPVRYSVARGRLQPS